MLIDSSMVISGFVSKVVNDGVDILKSKIKDADKNRKSGNHNLEARIYQVTIDAINEFTKSKYEGQDILYDVAEGILKGFKHNEDNKEAVRIGLKMLVSQVTINICEGFLETLCHEICKEKNRDLAIEVVIRQQEQTKEYVQEGLSRSYLNDEEINRKLDYLIEELDSKIVYEEQCNNKNPIESRAYEYTEKWNKNVFLNDFSKREKNVGENIKLKDIYLDSHLPHYTWKAGDEPLADLKELLEEYVIDINDKKMLLILGQPGIGKSTLITWIMANFTQKRDDVFVYKFAPDLENVDWQGKDILNRIFKTLGLRYGELDRKILILDGFDEIHATEDRKNILNQIYQELLGKINLKEFSLVVTCRENYVYDLPKIECDYITLQRWNSKQIQSFCRKYGSVSKSSISQSTLYKILENEKIFGIPLILYMVLALGVSIEKNSSIVDVYDQIFSMDGGSIYDRCIKNSRYEPLPHRIAENEIKQKIHQISQRIAFWIFENEPEGAFITKDKYEEICDDVILETSEESEDIKRDFLIANYFEPIKHCEGIGTDELHFVHRSIYEYFVVVYFFESMHNLKSKEEVAGKVGELLKYGHLSEQILEFIKYKYDKTRENDLSDSIREIIQIMLRDGMTYHVKGKYKNIVMREMNIFSNILEIVHLWNFELEILNDKIVFYLQYNHLKELNLSEANLREVNLRRTDLNRANLRKADLREVDLRGTDLSKADLREVNLRGANLSRADLSEANLSGANLREVNLRGADLRGANLRGADLRGINLRGADLTSANLCGDLRGANLRGADLRRAVLRGVDLTRSELEETIFDERQVDVLHKKYDLDGSRVYIFKTKEVISYKEYCIRKQNR